MQRLKDKKLFLLDMDGTLYLDDDLFECTIPFLNAVKANGGRYLFLTNNSSKSVKVYIEKLARLGIPATEEDWDTEYNDLILAVKVVDTLDKARIHINRYGTGHSETIVTNDLSAAEYFQSAVDAAAVYVNASTRFTDGGEFGFGAELGISTQKLHARGPMGLTALTTEKYLVNGNGQVR